MVKSIVQNGTLVGSLLVGATLCGMTAPLLRSWRGGLGPTAFAAPGPGSLAAVFLAVLIAMVLAIVVSRVCNTAVGMFAFGGSLFGLAFRLEDVREIAYAGGAGGVGGAVVGGEIGGVPVETLLWSAILLAATLVVFRIGGPLHDIEPMPGGEEPHWLRSVPALKSAAAGLVMLPVVWIVAQSPAKGQAIGAVFCGATAAGVLGRIISPHVQPILLFASPIAFGALGHVIAIYRLDVPLHDAFLADRLPNLLVPMPVDYAAGTLMGVAFGLGWARSFLHHEDDEEEAPTTSAASQA